MCIFLILILVLSGIWYFSLQVHCLETKYSELKIFVLHEIWCSILVASSLLSEIALGGACEAQQTVFAFIYLVT